MMSGDLGLPWLLPRLIGPSVAADVVFRSGSITGTQGRHFGLVSEVADNPVNRRIRRRE
jgi:enoyl-CoA hydratase